MTVTSAISGLAAGWYHYLASSFKYLKRNSQKILEESFTLFTLYGLEVTVWRKRNNFTLHFHYSSARPAPWCGGRTKTVSRTQSHLAVQKWNIYWECFVCNEIGWITRCIMMNYCRATFNIVFCFLLGSDIKRQYRVDRVQHFSIFFW